MVSNDTEDGKAVDAFRTISEVATELDVPKHVLRFWEGRFNQVRPMKRGGGRRFYRPEDVELLRGIQHLLHAEGYTIRGVQKILRRQGVEIVKGCWKSGAAVPRGDAADRAPEPTPPPAAVAKGKRGRRAATAGEDHAGIVRSVIAELERCRALLAKPRAAAARPAARGARA